MRYGIDLKIIKKSLDIAAIHNKKYLSTKIKSCEGKMKTNFHNDGFALERTPCVAHSVILIDSFYKSDEGYCPRVVLEECNYKVKHEIIKRFTTEDLFDSDCDSDFKSNQIIFC